VVGGGGDGVWSVQHPPQQVDCLLHQKQVSHVLQEAGGMGDITTTRPPNSSAACSRPGTGSPALILLTFMICFSDTGMSPVWAIETGRRDSWRPSARVRSSSRLQSLRRGGGGWGVQ